MFRTKTAEHAKRIAAREGLRYGWSVFDSQGWYVGTEAELRSIGCVDTRSAGTSSEDIGAMPCPNCGLRHPNGCVDA